MPTELSTSRGSQAGSHGRVGAEMEAMVGASGVGVELWSCRKAPWEKSEQGFQGDFLPTPRLASLG